MPGSPSKLAIQMRVLAALMIREMITRYGRSPIGFLWAVLEPAAFIAFLSILFAQIAHSPPVGRSFPMFYATGYVAFHLFHDIASVSARSVQVNRALLAFPPVTPLDTVLARFLLQALTGLVVAGLIFATVLTFFEELAQIRPALLLQAFGLAALLGLGVGLVNCWLFALSRSWEITWGIIARPLFLVSCVFFTFESLPAAAREILWYNPIVHLVGQIRGGFYPGYDMVHVAPGYVLGLGLGLSVIGLIALRHGPIRAVAA